MVLPVDFGRDHWSLLGYLYTRCVDYDGEIDRCHLRIKHRGPLKWTPDYGTRLRGHSVHSPNRLDFHDDLDCLEDFESAGWVESFDDCVKFTVEGMVVVEALNRHKMEGGSFSSFSFDLIVG